jgi:hypothetical protein
MVMMLLLPPLLRIVNVSSLTEMRQVLLSDGLCSGAGVEAATGAGVAETREGSGVCSGEGLEAVVSTVGAGVGVGVSVTVGSDAV